MALALADNRELEAAIARVMQPRDAGLRIVERRPNAKESTAPSEVLLCRLADGSSRRILLKYEAERPSGLHGHWHGLAYEASVYANVLASASTGPTCYGIAEWNGRRALVLDYLIDERGGRARGLRESDVAAAASSLGAFHRSCEGRLLDPRLRFLARLDLEYYLGWGRRTAEFAGHLLNRHPWLPGVCRSFARLALYLEEAPQTVVHGELYRENLLWHDGRPYPVDWDSAAVGPGEIDLAALTEGWSAGAATAAEHAYVAARWPDGAAHDFLMTLEAARMYLHFRWLGDWSDGIDDQQSRWRFSELRRFPTAPGAPAEVVS